MVPPVPPSPLTDVLNFFRQTKFRIGPRWNRRNQWHSNLGHRVGCWWRLAGGHRHRSGADCCGTFQTQSSKRRFIETYPFQRLLRNRRSSPSGSAIAETIKSGSPQHPRLPPPNAKRGSSASSTGYDTYASVNTSQENEGGRGSAGRV